MAARAETVASPMRSFLLVVWWAIGVGLTVTMIVDAGRNSTVSLPVWFITTTLSVLVGRTIGWEWAKRRSRQR